MSGGSFCWVGWLILIKRGERDQQQRLARVLDVLLNAHARLVAGEPGVKLTLDDFRSLRQSLQSDAPTEEAARRWQLLLRLVTLGVERLRWQAANPPEFLLLPREVPVVAPMAYLGLPALRRLQSVFAASLANVDALSQEQRAGQLLFSAIVYGRLLTPRGIERLQKSGAERWVATPHALWLRLTDPEDSDTPDARWLCDPLTELLLHRWWGPKGQPRVLGSRSPLVLIARFLRRAGAAETDLPVRLRDLLRWVEAATALTLPAFIVHHLQRPLEVTPLPDSVWSRLLADAPNRRGRALDLSDSLAPMGDLLRRQGGGLTPLTLQRKALRPLRSALAAPSKPAREQALRNLLATPPAGANLIHQLLTAYLLTLSEGGGARHRKLQGASLKRYLSPIAYPLLAACCDHDMRQADAEQWQHVLLQVIEQGRDYKTRDRVRDFARFLQQLDGIPDINLSILDDSEGRASQVNANIITPAEFDRAEAQLKAPTPRLARMAKLAMALGFYCGLRRNEIRYLRLVDISGASHPELLVRYTPAHRVKSPSSQRRLPLAVLLPSHWLKAFRRWQLLRQSESRTVPGESLLFCSPLNPTDPVDETELFGPAQRALRDVTGDQTLVPHTLRHSFAHWTLLRLLLPAWPSLRQPGLALLDHPEFSPARCRAFAEAFGGRGDGPLRHGLYQLAVLLGHSSPQTTLHSYLHLLDWLAWRMGWPASARVAQAHLPELVTGSRNGTWYRLEKKFTLNEGVDLESLLAYRRRSWFQSLPDPGVDRPKTKRGRPPKQSKGRVTQGLTLTELPRLLALLSAERVNSEEAAEALELDLGTVELIAHNLATLARLETRPGETRFVIPPNPPHLKADRKQIERLSRGYDQKPPRRALVRAGLEAFLANYHSHRALRRELYFTRPKAALAYRELLLALGATKASLRYSYLPLAGQTQEQQTSDRTLWGETVDVKLTEIEVLTGHWSPPTRGRQVHGGMVVEVTREGARGRERVYGWHYLLMLLLITHLHTLKGMAPP